jgi:hypothetical protein
MQYPVIVRTESAEVRRYLLNELQQTNSKGPAGQFPDSHLAPVLCHASFGRWL